MSIQRTPGYIAFCDNRGCLSSVEDAMVESPAKMLRDLTTTGQDRWKMVDGKLLCHSCWKAEEVDEEEDSDD